MLKNFLCLLLLLVGTHVYAASSETSPLSTIQNLLKQGHQTAGISQLHQLLNHEPNNYQAWFLLGVSQAEQRQFEKAITAFRKVIALQPKLAEPHNNLAVIYNETGDYQAAVNELEASLILKPGYITAQENIGDLYLKLAADAYRKVLDKSENPSLQQRYRRLVQVHKHAPKTKLPTAPAATVTPPDIVSPTVSILAETTPTPTLKTAQPSPLVVPTSNDVNQSSQAVLQALETWRLAWGNKDMATYFAAYSDDFQYDNKYVSFTKWQDYKTWAMRKRAFIKVTIENINTTVLAKNVIKVTFLQHFRSDSFNTDRNKEMLFRKTAHTWKIIYEASKR